MSKNFTKEFTMITDSNIERLYFGALPSEGRYFIKECEKLSPGNFRVSVNVCKGDLYYHFRTDTDWSQVMLDPNNMQIGAKNWHSICRIGTTSFNTIEYENSNSYVSKIDENKVEIKVIAHQEWIMSIDFISIANKSTKSYHMPCVLDSGARKYYKLTLPIENIESDEYVFLIKCKGGKELYFNANQQLTSEIKQPYQTKFKDLELAVNKYIGPVYQIFPDSFNSSGKLNDCGRKILNRDEYPDGKSFYGGNIKGIIEKIDYLVELGIQCVYLTPVFWAHSNDRYDCIDYMKIDPMLGTKEDFRHLCNELHRHGIKIVLDIVLNHCGTDFWMFKDLLEKQQKSQYKDYFDIKRFPVEYKEYFPNYSSWWGNGKMPQFNLENEDVVNYLFSCCKYWINEYGIDGWRIDVSSELKHSLLKRFRKEMLDEKKNLVIIGENWKDARTFLNGDELDGVTNYLCWWKAFYPFFCNDNVKVSQLASGLYESYFCYSHNRSLSNWNVIGSHDVARFYSEMHNKNNIYIVFAIQMFLPGNPVIYYGDEFALEGGDTPDNRRMIDWENVNYSIYANYKKMLSIRNNNPLICYGDFAIPFIDDEGKILVLKRYDEAQSVYEIINFSNKEIEIDIKELGIAEKNIYELLSCEKIMKDKLLLGKNTVCFIKARNEEKTIC